MGITQANFYFIKALDNYAYNFQESIEALNFALSYDEEHAGAHCLMGRLCFEYLDTYDQAEIHFKRALFYDKNCVQAYRYYIDLLIITEELDKAEKLIEKALLVKGINKPKMYYRIALIFEIRKMYTESKKHLKEAMSYCYDSAYADFLKGELKRLKEKVKLIEG